MVMALWLRWQDVKMNAVLLPSGSIAMALWTLWQPHQKPTAHHYGQNYGNRIGRWAIAQPLKQTDGNHYDHHYCQHTSIAMARAMATSRWPSTMATHGHIAMASTMVSARWS